MEKAVVELRTGVFRPDWSAVTTPAAQEALGKRAATRSSLIEKWLHALTPEEDRVWRAVLELYADLGRPPCMAETSIRAELPEPQVRKLLQQLQEKDLLAVASDGEGIRYVYPFMEAETGHRVILRGHVFNALCAVDALGVGDMYENDIEIYSSCRSCGQEIRITTKDNGRTLAGISPISAVVWYDVAYADSAASSCCRTIAFFCSDEHLEYWLEGRSSGTGMRLLVPEAFEVGRAIFGPVLRTSKASVPMSV